MPIVFVYSGGKEECNNQPLRADYKHPFAWVETAEYRNVTIEHVVYDMWTARVYPPCRISLILALIHFCNIVVWIN